MAPAGRRTLVLGGGGVLGVAWEHGVLEGLRREGVELASADTVIGTSAGSSVGARITTADMSAAYDEQLQPPTAEVAGAWSPVTMLRLALLALRPGDRARKWQRFGRAAARAHAPDSGLARDRFAANRARIGDAGWPDRDLRITAVDGGSGEFVVLDRGSGVPLLDAVAASCAVPLVWPPVLLHGRLHVDGGMRSPVNADLAEGAERVVVLAPLTQAFSREHGLEQQLARVGAARSSVVTPDEVARRAMGRNPLDPSRRAITAREGLRQGHECAQRVAAAWD
ncbi:MAG: patatin-like phospholipase family protein [Marmoricola sp.]